MLLGLNLEVGPTIQEVWAALRSRQAVTGRTWRSEGASMSVVDIGVYRDGARVEGFASLAPALAQARSMGGFVWASLELPSDAEVAEVAEVFGLHPLAAEDIAQGNQRPKIERYGDATFVVLRPARYERATDLVEFGEVHAFVGPGFIVSVQVAKATFMPGLRVALEQQPEVLSRGPYGVLHAILDRVVDDYEPVASSIDEVLAEIEDDLFDGKGSRHRVARRIYMLSREVIAFQRASRPLLEALRERHQLDRISLLDVELQRSFRDVVDHLIPICDRADNYRQLLQDALSVHLSLATQAREEQMARMTQRTIEQSDAMKKISSWAAIIFAPSLVSGIYGMNFLNMPELHWALGYPFAIALMVIFAGALYSIFKRKDWL